MSNRLLIVFLLVTLWSCEPPEAEIEIRQSVIEQEVEDRLKLHRQTKFRVCRDKVLAEANRIADSILIQQARLERDTMSKPPKPFKPEKPEIKTLIDSVPIKPFFRDSTLELLDTLDSN